MPKKRKKNIRKTRTRKIPREKWAQSLLESVPYVVSFLFLGSVIGGSYAYAVGSDLFELKTIRTNITELKTPQSLYRFTGLKPREWILSIDLAEVEERIRRHYPQYHDVQVKRVLPHEIQVEVQKRTPLAKIDWGKEYWIDVTGVVLNPVKTKKHLPIIQGLPQPKNDVQVGSRIRHHTLDQALILLREIQLNRSLGKHQLTHLDIRDARNFKIILDSSIEVRMGSRNWSEKLRRLEEAAKDMDLDSSKVRYLDLRFDDIIVGPR